jgi:Fe-S-cluster containining protein
LNQFSGFLKSFVPSEVCLACDGCCRYAEHDSVWSPLFLFEEILTLTQKNILPTCLFTHPASRPGEAARINLIEEKGDFFCPCLSLPDNKCKIYSHRPLDCRLYPFLFLRRDGKAYLALDKKCPYARKNPGNDKLREDAAALGLFLRSPEAVRIFKENPRIIQEYPVSDDLEMLELLAF